MKSPSSSGGPDPDPVVSVLRYDCDPETLYGEAAAVYAACDRAQLDALSTTAHLFLTDVISHLFLINPSGDAPYRHASLTETVRRYAAAAGGCSAVNGSAVADCSAVDGSAAGSEPEADGEPAADGSGADGEPLADGSAVSGEPGADGASAGSEPGAERSSVDCEPAGDQSSVDCESGADGSASDCEPGVPDNPASASAIADPSSSEPDEVDTAVDSDGDSVDREDDAEQESGSAHADDEPNQKSDDADQTDDTDQTGDDALPGFPRFRMDHTFETWIHSYSATEEIAELSSMRGATAPKTYAHISTAMTLIHGLPRFHRRCLAGEFTIEHVIAATQLCRDVRFEHLPRLDAYLDSRRADITPETFRKSLSMKVAVLRPVEDRSRTAHERRRVDLTTYPDGSAALHITGAADELRAFYLRIRAFATAIRTGNTAVFSDQLPPGACIEDDRTIAALMADIVTGTNPQIALEVITENTTTGETTTESIPLNLGDVTTAREVTEAIDAAARTAVANQGAAVANHRTDARPAEVVDSDGADTGTDTFAEVAATGPARLGEVIGETEDGRLRSLVKVGLNVTDHGQWAKVQAAMITTVPCSTLLGHSNLPGAFSDGSPIPADLARRIAGDSRTWTRILTDPATGTPIDAKATSYHIPASIRRTLIAQWRTCSVPGCLRPAETSEVDHIDPFNHDDPLSGGLTVFGNLHPLCKGHHMAKTNRRFDVRMGRDGLVYTFAHGTTVTTAPGDNPIDAANALILFDLGHPGAGGTEGGSPHGDPPGSDPGLPSYDAGSPSSDAGPQVSAPPDARSPGSTEPSNGRPPPIDHPPSGSSTQGSPGWSPPNPQVDPWTMTADSTRAGPAAPWESSTHSQSDTHGGSDPPPGTDPPEGPAPPGDTAPPDGPAPPGDSDPPPGPDPPARQSWQWDTGEPPF